MVLNSVLDLWLLIAPVVKGHGPLKRYLCAHVPQSTVLVIKIKIHSLPLSPPPSVYAHTVFMSCGRLTPLSIVRSDW